MNEESLQGYARLLVEHAINVRKNQRLFIWYEKEHYDFVLKIGEAAYDAGAGQIHYRMNDPLESAQLIRRGSPEQIVAHVLEKQIWLYGIANAGGALLALQGMSASEILSPLLRSHPESLRLYQRELSTTALELGRLVFEHRLFPATLAVVPTRSWARRVFPHLSAEEALEALFEYLFDWTYAGHSKALELAEREISDLAERATELETLGIREVLITGGGTDLRIGLPEGAAWHGGGLETVSEQRFCPNYPSYEVYTAPDRSLTNGRLVASRPIHLHGGAVVENLALGFRAGKVVTLEASRGAGELERCLAIDEGASYLGELALVAENSPIARADRVFAHPVIDENAACHVALGQHVAGTNEDKTGNRSAIHIDIPFSSAEVDVTATVCREGEMPLIERGRWASRFGETRP